MGPIHFRKQGLRNRPVDPERRVIPQQPAIVLGGIVPGHFVNHLGIRLQGAKTMGESLGDEELVPRFRAQPATHMLSIAGRASADIHRHVQNRAPYHADQLGLGRGRRLKCRPRNAPGGTESE